VSAVFAAILASGTIPPAVGSTASLPAAVGFGGAPASPTHSGTGTDLAVAAGALSPLATAPTPRGPTAAVSIPPPPTLDGFGSSTAAAPNPSSLSVSVTTTTPGDLLVLELCTEQQTNVSTSASVNDSFGGTWSEHGAPLEFISHGGGSPAYLLVFSALPPGRWGTDTIMISFTGAGNATKTATAIAFAFSGVNPQSPWDRAAPFSQAGSNAVSATGTIDTLNANDAIVGFLSVTTRETVTPTTGFTAIATEPAAPSDFTAYAEYDRVTATGSHSSSPAWTGAQSYGLIVAAVEGAAPPPTFNVTFASTGLPDRTPWSVTLGGTTLSNTTAAGSGTIDFVTIAGQFAFSVGGVAGYEATPPGGTVTVASTNVTVPLLWSPRTYQAVFTETGLSVGSRWSVTLGGSTLNSTGTTLTFLSPNGTFNWSVRPPANYVPDPRRGNLTIAGANVNASIVFTSTLPATYGVIFLQTGLLAGTSWAVTFAGVTMHTTGSRLSFSATNGTYTYSVGPVAGETPNRASANLTVNGAAKSVTIAFHPASTPGASGAPFGLSGGWLILGLLLLVALASLVGAAMVVRRRKRRPPAGTAAPPKPGAAPGPPPAGDLRLEWQE
jgi:hypothetical protein